MPIFKRFQCLSVYGRYFLRQLSFVLLDIVHKPLVCINADIVHKPVVCIMFLLMQVYIATIAYSCIAPIIIPFGLLYFIICFFVWRYQALYVYQSSYRANYVFTWAAHRIVACIGITVVFMASMFIVKKAIVQAILCLVLLLPIVIVFDLYIKARYDVLYHALPCAVLETAPRVNLDPELYVSPPMRKGAQGWFLEWGKAWEFFGAPRGYF